MWLRPDNIDLVPDPGDDPDVALFTGHARRRPGGAGRRAVGSRTAGPDGRRELLGRMGGSRPDGPDDLAPGFVLSAAVLRHLQADPLLPAELLPDGWPGAVAASAPTNGGTGGTARSSTLGPLGLTRWPALGR